MGSGAGTLLSKPAEAAVPCQLTLDEAGPADWLLLLLACSCDDGWVYTSAAQAVLMPGCTGLKAEADSVDGHVINNDGSSMETESCSCPCVVAVARSMWSWLGSGFGPWMPAAVLLLLLPVSASRVGVAARAMAASLARAAAEVTAELLPAPGV